MEIREMDLEQVETRLAEVKDLLHADDADLEALESEIRSLKDRRAEINAEIEQRKAEVNEVINTAVEIETFEKEEVRKVMEMKELRNTTEYVNAYAEYIKGDDKQLRALLTENASGTIAVPELVYDIVKTAWEREGIMSLVRKSYLKGNLKVGFEISSTGAAVHTEGAAAVSEETLVLGVVNLVPVSIKKWISISDEAMDLRGEDFLRYIYDELAYQIAKKAADTLIAKIESCGTVSTTTQVGVPVVTAASIALGTVANALAALSDEAVNPVIIMNKQSWASFKEVQYAGSYGVDIFEGLDVRFNNTIKAFTAASTGDTYAIVGDLANGALANFPNGDDINFKFDDLTLATSDLVKITGREYIAIEPIAPNHFVKIQK